MIYLDCNATTPMEPEVKNAMLTFMDQEFGNEGSRTHIFGARAKKAVNDARNQVAGIVGAGIDEVVFTSGATESNNLAILGLGKWALRNGYCHAISTQIEHKAVIEPMEQLQKQGITVDFIEPDISGSIDPNRIKEKLRKDTFLVSVMHANNETGILQPVKEVAALLENHHAFFHVDAAQTFGKEDEDLKNKRIDLISASAHKIYGPKGVGLFVYRNRNSKQPPIEPLMFGGSQENGLRPGTLPVHLIVGFGKAAEMASKEKNKRLIKNKAFREKLLKKLSCCGPKQNGSGKCLQHTINISFPNVSSEAFMVACKNIIAVSNGAACTSVSYKKSHVLTAMKIHEKEILNSIRFSWCHLTPDPDWELIVKKIKMF